MKKILIGIYLIFLSLTLYTISKDTIFYPDLDIRFKKDFVFPRKEEEMRYSINLFLDTHNRSWTETQKRQLITALEIGEIETGIPYEFILSIISIESAYKTNIKSRICNHGCDYGLTQQNERYLASRYKRAQYILSKYDIKKNLYRYDIMLNVISGFIYTKSIITELNQKGIETKMSNVAAAYNAGVMGSIKYDTTEYRKNFLFAFNYLKDSKEKKIDLFKLSDLAQANNS
jgi:hypothetical protein